MSRLSVILRFGISAILASALLILGGGWLVHEYVGHRPDRTVGLTIIRGVQLLAHPPGERPKKHARQRGPMITGFVQVQFKVGANGRAHGIKVIRSEPPGEYEQAAREIIAGRQFKPNQAGTTRTQVVHFQVPASVLTQKTGAGHGPHSSG